MGNRSSTRAGKDPYMVFTNWSHHFLAFWNDQKIQDPKHKDFRPSSDDLDIPPGCWKYNTEAYEESLREMVKNERNLTVLEGNIKKH